MERAGPRSTRRPGATGYGRQSHRWQCVHRKFDHGRRDQRRQAGGAASLRSRRQRRQRGVSSPSAGPGDKQVYRDQGRRGVRRSDSGQWEQVGGNRPTPYSSGNRPDLPSQGSNLSNRPATPSQLPGGAPRYLKATIRISIVSSKQETWATSARAASSNRALREASKEAGTEVAGIEVVAVAGGGVSAPCFKSKAHLNRS